jgi:hypothetical protein
MHDIKSTTEKNAPPLRAILMAMTMRWCNAESIARYSRSTRARYPSTYHIGCRHRVSICPVLPPSSGEEEAAQQDAEVPEEVEAMQQDVEASQKILVA